jgi:uncharacterized membrane protein
VAEKNAFLEIKRAFNKATIKEVQKRAGTNKQFYFSISVFMLFGFLAIIFRDQMNEIIFNIGFLVAFVLWIYFLSRLIRKVELKFAGANKLGLDISFFKENRKNWMGERFIIFAEQILELKLKFKLKKMIKWLTREIEEKKFSFVEKPFVTFLIALILIIIEKIFDAIDTISKMAQHPQLLLQAFIPILLIALFVLWIYRIFAIDIIRSEASKIKDLKLFLIWYKQFGKEVIGNLKAKDSPASDQIKS